MDILNITNLLENALSARNDAYCPYSNYSVGAALLCKDGRIIKGCNIENASFGAGICAERTALYKAVSDGYKEFEAIAVCGGKIGEAPTGYAFPCGICRQALSEFCDADFNVIVAKSVEDYKIYTLSELLPESFDSSNLE